MRLMTLVCIATALLALPVAAQEEAESFGPIDGWVEFSNNTLAPGATVMICSYYCQTAQADLYGHFRFDYYPTSLSTLSFYAWMDNPPGRTGMWGSNEDVYLTEPTCNNWNQFGYCQSTGYTITFFLYPRPLQPQLLQPANGQTNVALTGLQLSWTDGMDAARRQFHDTLGQPYSNNLTYDIYGSGCCIAPQLYASNQPCNGSNGTCTFNVPSTLSPGASYSWYVKARYHVPLYGYNINLNRQSYTSGFTTTGSPSMTYSFRTYYSFYLSALNCGGNTLNSSPQSVGTCEKFKIEGTTGDLLNGDQIHIRANNGSYWSAVNGGGDAVNANAAYPGAWETFRIWKLNNSGQGAIVGGDNIAISCSNGQYVVAEGGGYGGTVNCNRTTAAQWETFGINPWP